MARACEPAGTKNNYPAMIFNSVYTKSTLISGLFCNVKELRTRGSGYFEVGCGHICTAKLLLRNPCLIK